MAKKGKTSSSSTTAPSKGLKRLLSRSRKLQPRIARLRRSSRKTLTFAAAVERRVRKVFEERGQRR